MTEQRKQKERKAFFDFFNKEQKKQTEIKINVMDYTHSAWGNACFFNPEYKSAGGRFFIY